MSLQKIIIPIAALLVGCATGALVATRHWLRESNRLVLIENQNEALSRVHTLKLLHEGKTDTAMSILEIELDSNIVTLGNQARKQDPKTNEIRQTLQKIAAYRNQSGYVIHQPEIKQAVDNAFKDVVQ